MNKVIVKEEAGDDFVCSGCGNKQDICHKYVWESWLVQDTLG